MAVYLKREHTRLRVKETTLPASVSEVLGVGIDVMALPEGHLCCAKCHGYKFECWIYLDAHRIEMGCMECGENYRLLFPLDVRIPANTGRFTCRRHPKKGMILIHNTDVIGIGCELCSSEIRIPLKTKSDLVVV